MTMVGQTGDEHTGTYILELCRACDVTAAPADALAAALQQLETLAATATKLTPLRVGVARVLACWVAQADRAVLCTASVHPSLVNLYSVLDKWSASHDIALKSVCLYAMTCIVATAPAAFVARHSDAMLRRLLKGTRKTEKRGHCLVLRSFHFCYLICVSFILFCRLFGCFDLPGVPLLFFFHTLSLSFCLTHTHKQLQTNIAGCTGAVVAWCAAAARPIQHGPLCPTPGRIHRYL